MEEIKKNQNSQPSAKESLLEWRFKIAPILLSKQKIHDINERLKLS